MKSQSEGWSEETARELLRSAFPPIEPDPHVLLKVESSLGDVLTRASFLQRRQRTVRFAWWAVWLYLAFLAGCAAIGSGLHQAATERRAAQLPQQVQSLQEFRSTNARPAVSAFGYPGGGGVPPPQVAAAAAPDPPATPAIPTAPTPPAPAYGLPPQ